MKITYFVNAMMLLEGTNSRVLCDPWVTFDRQSASGLYNFPETALTREDIGALRPDFIYITHTHADHFDPVTLSLFDQNTPILVSYYENNFTERAIRRLGFTDVRVADPADGLALNGDDRCWIEPSAVYSQVDSIGVFRIDGQIVLNANDNPFHENQLRRLQQRHGPIDLACVPFNYLGPYPAFYENLTEREKAAEADAKKMRNYETLVSFILTLEPRRVFLFSAEAIYGGAKALLHPYYGVGLAQEAVDYARDRYDFEPVLLSEGCSFDISTGKAYGKFRERRYETEREYVKHISKTTGQFDEGGSFFISPSERINLTNLLTTARINQRKWQARLKTSSQATYFIDVGEEKLYRLSLTGPDVTRVRQSDISDASYEIFRIPYGLMVGLLTRHYNYSNVKTQHMSFFREPNRFDSELHILMSYLQL